MKFFNYVLLVVGCLVAATSVAGAPDCGTSGTLVVGTQVGVPPFEFFDSTTGFLSGFDIAIACELRQRLGFRDIQFRRVNPTTATALNSGQVTVIISGLSEINPTSLANSDLALVKYADFAYSLIYSGTIPAGITPANGLSDLAGKAVGVVENSYEDLLLQALNLSLFPNVTIVRLPNVPTGLVALGAGAIYAFFSSNAINNNFAVVANRFGFQVQALLDVVIPANNPNLVPFTSTGLGIAVSSSCCQLYANIQQAISDMVADGTYAAIARASGLNTTFTPSPNLSTACAGTVPNVPVRNALARFLFNRFCPCNIPTVVPSASGPSVLPGR